MQSCWSLKYICGKVVSTPICYASRVVEVPKSLNPDGIYLEGEKYFDNHCRRDVCSDDSYRFLYSKHQCLSSLRITRVCHLNIQPIVSQKRTTVLEIDKNNKCRNWREFSYNTKKKGAFLYNSLMCRMLRKNTLLSIVKDIDNPIHYL